MIDGVPVTATAVGYVVAIALMLIGLTAATRTGGRRGVATAIGTVVVVAIIVSVSWLVGTDV